MLYSDYAESAEAVRKRIGDFVPEVLVVLGSGLGHLADEVEDAVSIPYSEIPHSPVSTAPGHAGRFVFGRLAGKNCAVMQGRMHLYEGYDPSEVPYLVRVARLLGAEKMLITNAAGGICTDFHPGQLVILTDFIKFIDSNVLTGPNIDEFGPRFPDMTHVFDEEYIETAKRNAARLGIDAGSGVYAYFTGPQYETPAEIRMLRLLGADVVGMSTVPECIAARHAGMRILGITLVTNMAAGVLDVPLSGSEVVAAAEAAKSYFSEFLLSNLAEM